MYCYNCGKEISDSSKFCQHCGSNLEDSETISEPANNAEPSTPGDKTTSATKYRVPPGIIIILIPLLILGVVYFSHSSQVM